jgi:glycosyltransferase involved in cell wall biosynthesis
MTHTVRQALAKASVVIAARNEQILLPRCLTALTRGVAPGELEIVVVCNGCSDRTADVARAFGAGLKVVEIPIGNKAHALNVGDQMASVFPRVYLDADIRVDGETVLALAELLNTADPLVGGPRYEVDTESCSWPVKAYFAVWKSLPYAENRLVGAGLYAMNEAARRKVGPFPDVLAEDEYVRLKFPYAQRRTLESGCFYASAPTNLSALIKLRARWMRGAVQLRERYSSSEVKAERRDYVRPLRRLLGRPALWPAAGVYVLVWSASWGVARYQRHLSSNPWYWNRDETSRR